MRQENLPHPHDLQAEIERLRRQLDVALASVSDWNTRI
jgi:hypothetical protein